MTGPRTPEELISRAAQRLTAQREAARSLSDEISRQRQAQSEAETPDGQTETR